MAATPTLPNSSTIPLPSPSVKPICPFFYECGGCDTQDIAYTDQLTFKEQWLKLLFAPVVSTDVWDTFLHTSQAYPIFFLNKIRFGFVEQEGKVWPSRHRKGEEAADIPVDLCYLQSEESIDIINFTAAFATTQGWSLYDPATGTGWLKHLLIRQSRTSGDMLLSLVTDDAPIIGQDEWVKEIRQRVPYVKSLWHSVSWGRSNERMEDIRLWGDVTLVETVGELRYHISPQAFFQT